MKKVLSVIITIAVIIALRFLVNWITAPKCTTCDEKIIGTAYRAEGKIYCKTHKPAGYIYK